MLRAVVLALFAAGALAAIAITLPSIGSPAGVFGWNIGPDGVTVISVTPHHPAEDAGIVPGDRIVYSTMPLRGRINTIFVTPVRPADRISFEVMHRGEARMVTLAAAPWPRALTTASNAAGLFSELIAVVVAIALVALRPNVMTWAFLLSALYALIPLSGNPYSLRSDAAMAAVLTANGIAEGIVTAATFVFIGRFPNNASRRWTAWLDRAAVPWALVVAASWAYVMWAIVASPAPPLHLVLVGVQYAFPAVGTAIILAALVAGYAAARGSLRQRILPVLAAFGLSTLFGFLWTTANDLTADAATVLGIAIVAQLFDAAIPLTVAYAVIRYRVIDVNFVISRTVVYGILTAGIVVTFALVHYLVGKLLESTRVAVAIELAVAVAYGVWLNALHDRLDSFVDRVFFRRWHLAEARLDRVAHALPHAETKEFVDKMLASEPADALSLASAAVFRRDCDGRFTRRDSVGWSAAHAQYLEGNGRLVVELRATLAPVDLAGTPWASERVPEGTAQPVHAVPVCARHRVEAIVLYGSHTGGEALYRDELHVLRRLALGAAQAYDHLAVAELARKIQELEIENSGLRQAQSALSEATAELRAEIAKLHE
jgi:hypothetical protein